MLSTDAVMEAMQRGVSHGGEDLKSAILLAESLPEPGSGPDDRMVEIVFQVGFHAEALCDWACCKRIYERCLSYPVHDTNIHAGAWFRCGWCAERLCDWRGAIEAYRQALLLGRDWPHMMDLARWRLAQLYVSASRYEEASQLLVELRKSAPHPEIPSAILTIRLAQTLLRSGRPLDARRELEPHTSGAEGSHLNLEACKLLAAVYEELGRSDAAAECYRRILASPGAGKKIRVAAMHRLADLR